MVLKEVTQCYTPSFLSLCRWSRQRERVEQLALQAVYNATQLADEFVKEFLTTHNKVCI